MGTIFLKLSCQRPLQCEQFNLCDSVYLNDDCMSRIDDHISPKHLTASYITVYMPAKSLDNMIS